MKTKYLFISFIILISLLFTSCSFGASVEELLVAPSLSDNQKAVLSALEKEHPNRITFVYPLSGSNRSAIQKYDLDSDGLDEIIAFYKDNSEGLNAYISILEKEDDMSYSVVSTMEGFGDGINSVFYLDSLVAEKALLVEWKSPSKSSNTISAYTYIDNNLEIGFEENSLDMLVMDFDDDATAEFCYIVPASLETGFSLKYVQSTDTTIFSRSQFNLSNDTLEIISLSSGMLANNRKAIFIDESTKEGLQTEIFRLSEDNSRLQRVEIDGGLDLLKLSLRPDDSRLKSRDFEGITCFPSSVSPNKDVLFPDMWIYWYSMDETAVVLERVSYFSEDMGCLLSLPVSWLTECSVNEISDNEVEIINNVNYTRLLSLVMLSVDDDVMSYVTNGYYLIGTTGTFRYYISVAAEPEEENMIRKSFVVFD